MINGLHNHICKECNKEFECPVITHCIRVERDDCICDDCLADMQG